MQGACISSCLPCKTSGDNGWGISKINTWPSPKERRQTGARRKKLDYVVCLTAYHRKLVERVNDGKYEKQLLLFSQGFPCLNLIKPQRASLRLLVPTRWLFYPCFLLFLLPPLIAAWGKRGGEICCFCKNHCRKNSQNINDTVLASKG